MTGDEENNGRKRTEDHGNSFGRLGGMFLLKQ